MALGPDEDGIGLISRRDGAVVGFALHPLAPGTRLAPEEVGALLDPDPVDPPDLAVEEAAPPPSLTIAICTRDRPELLEGCLRSLRAAGSDPAEVLVVDNAPTDGRTREVATAAGVGYVVEPCPGLDIARNRALATDGGEVLAFVDDDVEVDRHWRDALLRAWAAHRDADALTGQILPLELETDAQVAFERRGGFRGGNRTIRYEGQDRDDNPTYPYSPGMFGAGANLSVRRRAALRLGGFDDALDTGPPLPGGGDIDMLQRIVRTGAPLVYEPRAVVFHRHRRDHDGLRRQYDSWGRSAMAVVAKTYRSDPAGRPKLRRYVRWFLTTQARAARSGGAPGTEGERGAAAAELRGGVAGLLGTYGRSVRRSGRRRRRHSRPNVAILPWGHVIEDYLDPIGLSIDDFADEQAGGWLFGFAEALARVEVDTTIVCWSRAVARPTRRVHLPTGATLWLLPPSRAYRAARAHLQDPYAWGRRAGIGDRAEAGWGRGVLAHALAPFLATTPLALARVLRREGCSTLLSQEYEEGRFDVCIALGWVLRLPVAATFQGGDHTRTRLERLVRSRTIRAASALVVADEREAARLVAHHGADPERIVAIPNPLDPATVPVVPRAEARAALGLADDRRVVAWHGRVDVVPKGLDTLVEAWGEVRGSGSPSPALLLLGTGTSAAWLHEQVDGWDEVRWRDEYVLDRDVIGTHLSAADLYVLPSRQEGFPVAPVEAMAAGLPVVATDAPGVRAVVGDGEAGAGTIVAVDDAAGLAAALRTYLDDDERTATAGRAARARVDGALSLDAVGARLRAVLVDRGERG